MNNETLSIIAYQDVNYTGASQQFTEGSYDIGTLTVGNDQISSLKIPAGMRVTLYEHGGFTGRTKVFTTDTWYVGDDFNDIASGLKVERIGSGSTLSPNVLEFDGTSCFANALINVPETETTVSIWFKTTTSNCGLFSVNSDERGATGNDRNLWLKDGAICARIWNNEIIQTGKNTFADGKWHKVVHVFGGVIGGQRLYVDGNREATGTKSNSDFNWQNGISVGFSNDGINPYFNGQMSEVAIWSIARPERNLIMKTEVLDGSETGLMAYWNFKDGKIDKIVSRTKSATVLQVKGKVQWQAASDFSGVYVPVVQPAVIKDIRSQGKELSKPVVSISDGYKTNPPTDTAPVPVSELIKNGLSQFELGKRLAAAIQNSSLALSKNTLAEFSEAGEVVAGIIDAFITVRNPNLAFVKIKPGTSGEAGESLGDDPAANATLATLQTTALQVSGDATIFSRLNVQLKYAEFGQLKGKSYGVFKFLLGNSIGLGSILPSIPLLSAMEIAEPVLVVSSSGSLYDAPLDTGLAKGFNFFGKFNLGASNDKAFRFIGNFLGIQAISLHGAIDMTGSTTAYLIEATIPIDKYIINGSNFKVRFSKAKLGVSVKGRPLEPAIFVTNEMIITLKTGSDLTNLIFTGGLKLEMESITGSFTMQAENAEPYSSLSGNIVSKGEWKNPFGIPGITIRELALQAGLTYQEPWIDNVGVHGNLKIGDVDGTISVLVDVNDPDQFVLAGATDRITIMQILSFITPVTFAAYQAVPPASKAAIDKFMNLILENAKIYIVPSATSIGAIDFEEGTAIMGQLTAWGWHASMYLKISPQTGIEARGEMDSINISNVLRITGAQGDPLPMLKLKVTKTAIPQLEVSAKIYLLGITQELKITLNDSGFVFHVESSFTNKLDAKLDCSFGNGGNLIASGSIVFKLNENIPTPFGNIPLNVAMNTASSLKAGPQYGFQSVINGNFSFYGKTVTMPELRVNAAPNDFVGLYNAVVTTIRDNATTIFKSAIGTLTDWANAVKNGAIQYSGEIASVAKNVYGATETQIVNAYKTLGKGANEIANGFRTVYGYAGDRVTGILKTAGYGINEIGNALKSAYGFSAQAAATVLKGAGYAVNEVGGFVKGAYGLGADAAASALKGAGYAAEEAGRFLKDTYGLGADALSKVMTGAGYAANEVKDAFTKFGGDFVDFFKDKMNPTKW